MKVVISPAKSLDFERPLPTALFSELAFQKEVVQVSKVLSGKKPAALRNLMSISEELAQLNWQRNQAFTFPFTPKNARPAVFAFNGDVYQGLDAYSLGNEQISRMQDVVRILSGLYGILKPLDLIQPYRLEMGTALKVGKSDNLYAFWKKRLTAYLNAEMQPGELLVNLASVEYFSALDSKALKANIITPVFKDESNGKLKVISFFAKKARGAMVRYILDTGAQSLDDLLSFNTDGYTFSKEHTQKESAPVFIR
jgi:cytoplasmic iron level regulating protein YaaA (DUF328/UPF0246 family)